MSSDPSALSAIWAGLPDEADYDALYAALLATERGRWFLAEHAARNLNAATPTPAAATYRASLLRDLIELAAAISRLRDEIAGSEWQALGRLAAAERIQDVAFALREREIDAALCDGLDAAIREIGDAGALSDAAAERARSAADLVRDLAARINDMIARSIDAETEAATADEARSQMASEHDAPPRLAFFEAAVMESESFAQAVATLVASLPTITDAAAPVSDVPGEQTDAAASPANLADEVETPAADASPEPVGEGVTNVVVLSEAAAPTEPFVVEPSPVLSEPTASEEPTLIELPPAEAFVVERLPVLAEPAASEEPTLIEPPPAEAFVIEPLPVLSEPAGTEAVSAPFEPWPAEAFVVDPVSLEPPPIEMPPVEEAADVPADDHASAVPAGLESADVAEPGLACRENSSAIQDFESAENAPPDAAGAAATGNDTELAAAAANADESFTQPPAETWVSTEISSATSPPEPLATEEPLVAETPSEAVLAAAPHEEISGEEPTGEAAPAVLPNTDEMPETPESPDAPAPGALRVEEPWTVDGFSENAPGDEPYQEAPSEALPDEEAPPLQTLDLLMQPAAAAELSAPEPEAPMPGDGAPILSADALSPDATRGTAAHPPAVEPSDAVATADGSAAAEAETSSAMLPDLQSPAGPDDDPGDLFDPLPSPSPIEQSPLEPTMVEPVPVAEAIAPAAAELAPVEEAPIELTAAEPKIITDAPIDEPPAAMVETPSDVFVQHEPDAATKDETPSAAAPPELMELPVLPAFPVSDEEIEADDAQLFATAPDSEAMAQVPSPETASVAIAPPVVAEVKPIADALAPRVAPVTVTRPAARPAPSDPLIAVHALSDEEIIALFS